MRVSDVLCGARVLLAKGWDPLFPRRLGPPGPSIIPVLRAEEFAELGPRPDVARIICDHNHPEAIAWDVEGAVMRAAGGDSGASLAALGLLDEVLGAPSWEGSCAWGGAYVREWCRRPGRMQSEVVALVAKACARAVRTEQSEANN